MLGLTANCLELLSPVPHFASVVDRAANVVVQSLTHLTI